MGCHANLYVSLGVHLIHHLMNFYSGKNRKPVAADFLLAYEVVAAENARYQLDAFEKIWHETPIYCLTLVPRLGQSHFAFCPGAAIRNFKKSGRTGKELAAARNQLAALFEGTSMPQNIW